MWVAPPPEGKASGGELLRGIASSLGGWLSGSSGVEAPSFLPLRRDRTGDALGVQQHVQNLQPVVSQGEAVLTVASLATQLCVWDDAGWNYRSIFRWVAQNIE